MHTGCFSPYMMISSTLQTVFGFTHRSEQEREADLSMQFQLELRKAKEEFQDELEAKKIADMRAKMAVARKYRAKENFDRNVLQHKTLELENFFMSCLPISGASVSILLEAANDYRRMNYDYRCPLNVVLFHTKQNLLDYSGIYDELDKIAGELGNVVYRRWCDKDVAHNSAILNLHAVMSNIPTLVISPCFHDEKIYFTVSMWEAQTDAKPLIRPLIAYDCPKEYIGPKQTFTEEGKLAIEKKLIFITEVISGCARDSYMFITQGATPTLPKFLKKHEGILKQLQEVENHNVRTFLLDEYRAMQSAFSMNDKEISTLLTKAERDRLTSESGKAFKEISCIMNLRIESK